MRRPRAGLVTPHSGGLIQPPAGITTGWRKAARDGDEVGGGSCLQDWGCRVRRVRLLRPEARCKEAFKNAASGAPGGALSRSQGTRRRLASVSGGFADRPGSLASSRVCRRSAPLDGGRELQFREGLPGADSKNTGDESRLGAKRASPPRACCLKIESVKKARPHIPALACRGKREGLDRPLSRTMTPEKRGAACSPRPRADAHAPQDEGRVRIVVNAVLTSRVYGTAVLL